MWTPIIGFEDIYELDEYGNVRNINTGLILKWYKNRNGYKYIDLSKSGKKFTYTVHKLVALHYVPNPNNFPIVLHKDNNKLNTYYKNLEWGTYSKNNAQAIRDGLNTIPRPDNTNNYLLYNNDDSLKCKGAKEVINALGYGTTSLVYCLLRRNGKVVKGPFEGYSIKKIIIPISFKVIHPIKFTKIDQDVQRSSLDEGGNYPLM